MISIRLRRPASAIILLTLLLCLAANPGASAAEVAVTGVGDAIFSGDEPDAAARVAALHDAKVDAVENYVLHVTMNSHPVPVSYRDYLYLSHFPKLQQTLDKYLSDTVIVTETIDAARKRYRVTIRATLDEQRFDNVLPFPRRAEPK